MQKTRLYKRCLRCLALVLALAHPLCGLAETYSVVKGGMLNLRQEASLESKVLGQYPTGTWMTVLETADGWSKVTVGEKTGYVVSKYLADDTSKSTVYVRTNTGAGLNLRNKPSLTGDILGSFKTGTAISVLARGNGWYRVSVEGLEGYMNSRYLTASIGSGSGSTATGYPKQGVVSNPGANQVLLLRENASTDARVIGYYRNGVEVKLVGESGSFYKVTVDGKNGYMMKKFIRLASGSTGSSALPATPFIAELVNPNGNSIVNFRKAPGLSASIIKAYPIGTAITVTEVGDVWCRAEIDGVEGFVSRYFFKAEK